jgi:hypothetical protein
MWLQGREARDGPLRHFAPGDAWSKAADAVVTSSSARFEFVDPSGSIER